MEKALNEILVEIKALKSQLGNVETDVKELKPMVKELYDLKPKIMESHQWLDMLVENKEIQKAEMDCLKNDAARVKGVLKGFGNSLELLEKAE